LRDFIDVLELGSYLGCADWVKYPFEKLVSILCLNLPPVTKPVFPSPISQSLFTVNAKKIGAASLLFVPVGTSAVYIVILRTGRGRGKHRGTEGTEREGQGKMCTAQSQVRITKTSGFKKNSGSIKNSRQGTKTKAHPIKRVIAPLYGRRANGSEFTGANEPSPKLRRKGGLGIVAKAGLEPATHGL
jgi:hypothetical protein